MFYPVINIFYAIIKVLCDVIRSSTINKITFLGTMTQIETSILEISKEESLKVIFIDKGY